MFLLTGAAQGFVLAWGLAAVVWWVVELRLAPLRLALLGTALVLTILLAETPTGVLADLYGRKASVVASYVVMGCAMALMAVSPAFGAMMVAQAVWAVGWTLQSGAATAWVTDEYQARSPSAATGAEEPGRASFEGAGPASGTTPETAARPDPARIGTGAVLDQLIVRHAMWRSVGVMVGIAVTVAAGTWSLRGAMVIMGALSAGFAVYLAVAMAESGFTRLARSSATGGGAWREAATIWRLGVTLALRRRTLLAVVSAAAITGFSGEAIERLGTLRLVELGLPDHDGGEAVVFFGVAWFIMAALSIPVMIWLRRRLARRDGLRDARLLARLLVVASAGALALAVSPVFAVALAGWGVLAVAGETTYPLAEAMANREASSGVRATVISFLGQAEALGEVLGGVTLGLVAQFVSLPIAMAVAAGMLAVAAIPVALAGREQPAAAA